VEDCPLPLSALPALLQKHADPGAPVPLRLMGAKGLVPAAAPVDLVMLLFMLSHDADAGVRDTAVRTAAGLPDRISSVALRAEGLAGPVLDWLADRYAGSDAALELVLLNPSTPDGTVARLAAVVSQRLTEIVRQNELRLLRHEGIIRGLCANPAALASTLDGACDFCVRNGLTLLDEPRLVEAHRRVHGVDPRVRPAQPHETAAGLLAEYPDELAREGGDAAAAPADEQSIRRLTMTQRIGHMSVAEKIKLATLGNKEARGLLVRDANRLVSLAAATSPRITEGEILTLATSRTVNAEVLRYIYSNREFLKSYAVKSALVKNPKVPLPTALKMMYTLQERDIRELTRDRNVSNTIQAQAKAFLMKREQAAKGPGGRR
jgi:hypothetical protein